MGKVYSFSVKSEEDKQIVEDLKLTSAKKGISFSRIVINAIKREAKARKQNANK